jgi:hypothetical protein
VRPPCAGTARWEAAASIASGDLVLQFTAVLRCYSNMVTLTLPQAVDGEATMALTCASSTEQIALISRLGSQSR